MNDTRIKLNADGTLTMGREQDASPILQHNAEYKKDNVFNTSKDMHKVASIPSVLIDQWCKEWGCNLTQLFHEPEFKLKLFRRLNDPEWQALRTDEGRL